MNAGTVVQKVARNREYRRFLSGESAVRPFVCLDPSSFAALYAGRSSGYPTLEDQVAFHAAFPNDAGIGIPYDLGVVIPELNWQRKRVRTDPDGTVFWEETLATPDGDRRRVTADRFGTIPWLVEPAIREEADFALADYYADLLAARAADLARSMAGRPDDLRARGFQPAATILSAFELQYLVDYPDMPLFFMDWPKRYLASVERMHRANLALLEALADVGIELFHTGSAGLELLSPEIFRRAIVPFQRDFNDRTRKRGCFVDYHICGHSRQLIEQGVIDAIRPTIFETCSAPPCGNNEDLGKAVRGIDESIITKGNLALELLRDGTPGQIAAAVGGIAAAVGRRRHIIGQADATILAGTPTENIRAFLNAVRELENA